MTGLSVQITEQGLDRAIAVFAALDDVQLLRGMDIVGRTIQLQTRRRLEVEKTAPDGTAWKPNRAGSSILYASGTLSDSIDYMTRGREVHVGSPLPYAGIHHHGGVIKPKNGAVLVFTIGGKKVVVSKVVMPARPYMGLSADNIAECESVIGDFIAAVLQ